MTLVVYVVVTVLVATGLFFGIRYFVRTYVRYRDSRLIICPENREAAMVEVDGVHAALTSALGQPDIRLQNCWRWDCYVAQPFVRDHPEVVVYRPWQETSTAQSDAQVQTFRHPVARRR